MGAHCGRTAHERPARQTDRAARCKRCVAHIGLISVCEPLCPIPLSRLQFNTYTCRLGATGSYLTACEGIPRPSADSAGASTGDDHSDVATSSGADDGDAHSDGSSSGADDDHTNTYTSSGNDGGASSSSTGPCEDFECAAAAMAPSAMIVAALIAAARAAL